MLSFLVSCGNKEVLLNSKVEEETTKIQITRLTEKPRVKTTEDKVFIKEVIETLNSIDTSKPSKINIKGWDTLIILQGKDGNTIESIGIVGDFITISPYAYEGNSKVVEEIKALYEGLEVEERDLEYGG